MVTGGFRSREVMDNAIKSGFVSMIGVGRPLCVQSDCVQQLLDGKISKLPSPENDWDLPWYFKWLRYLVVGNLMKIGGEMLGHYNNLFRLADGNPPLCRPNLIMALAVVGQTEMRKAKELKGLPENDPTLQPRKNSSPLKKYILSIVVIYVLYKLYKSLL